MTLLKIDGFEHKDPTRYGTAPAFQSLAADTRFGVGSSMSGTGLTAFTPSAKVFVGIAFKPAAASAFLLLKNNSGATNQVYLSWTLTGAITIHDGVNVLMGTSADSVLPAASWGYVEVSATIHPTAGEVVVRVNGSVVLSVVGDTYNGAAPATFDAVELRGTGSGARVDDLYVCNDLGSDHNTFLGDVRVTTLKPAGNGNYSGLTGSDGNSVDNYLLVDELPPSEADYVGSAVAGTKDTYALTDLVVTDPVLAVQTGISAFKSDAGAMQARAVLRTGGADYAGATKAIGTTKSSYLDLFTTNPNTGLAWTAAEVNALEAGMEVMA